MTYAPHGPFKIEVVFSIEVGNGMMAEASMDCPIGNLPTDQDLATLAENAMKTIKETFPDAKWPNREGFLSEELSKRAMGISIAVPERDKQFEHKVFQS